MLLVYTTALNRRITYIFDFIFSDIIGTDYTITLDRDEFQRFNGPKLNYSKAKIGDEIFIAARNILFEKGLKEQEPGKVMRNNSFVIFPTLSKDSTLNFDPFAASFYCLTRYEEYFPFIRDQYNRFEPSQSILYTLGLNEKPVVNIWASEVKQLLTDRFPAIKLKQKKYKFIPTLDIDSGYAYRCKGLIRNAGGFLRSGASMNFPEFIERFRVITGRQTDPFDTFEYQIQIHKKFNIKPIYFILFAEYGHNDKNLPTYNRKFHSLIKRIGDYSDVGIHPSFNSNIVSGKLEIEIKGLSKVLNKEITKSRQHFLMLSFPETYRRLIDLDIQDDYTMGFASLPGFRAGTCDQYYFYDLETDSATNLRIHPFTVMEGTLNDYMHLSPDEAVTRIKKLVDTVKSVDGTFISLWHNESLSDQKRWTGWRKVYEELLEYAI